MSRTVKIVLVIVLVLIALLLGGWLIWRNAGGKGFGGGTNKIDVA